MIKAVGNVIVTIREAENVQTQQFSNLVVDSGVNLFRDRIAGTSAAYATHFALGTSATAVSAAQTALIGEVARDALTSTITSTSKAVKFEYYLPAGTANGSTLREIGLFTQSSGGIMVARALLSTPIVKTVLVTATFSWTITLSAV
jgi:hypothetical protein